jgi:hypothetical protein
MVHRMNVPVFAAFVAGTVIALLACHPFSQSHAADTAPPAKTDELAVLRGEVERLKGMVPDQSHAMSDVGYHYANLYFAAREQNWPLADFYASETKSHLRWAVRIIPVRKDPAGRDVDLRAILEAIENSSLKDVQDAVKAKDAPRFEKAYRVMLESCYSCHQASGKPYLHPHVPDAPEVHILDVAPQPPAGAAPAGK